jgi:O-acetyl-ADP-ribose deacetylase (regulator of RNase III)
LITKITLVEQEKKESDPIGKHASLNNIVKKSPSNVDNKLESKIITRFFFKMSGGDLILIEKYDGKTVFKFTNGSLNITIKQGDLSAEICDAIVNPTRNTMFPNGGLDTVIHQKFGAFFSSQVNSIGNEMQDNACPVGQSRIFIAKAERDPNAARYVINTVGPNYKKEGQDLAAFHLQSCYYSSLSLANTYGLSSIAYPAISCGAFHFPLHEAA